MIHREQVERARRATSIEDECARRNIQLKRISRIEKAGPCPVCRGRDRFAINIRKQVWHCRGCGRGGDVIELVRHLDDCDFSRAVETLAGPAPDHGKETDDERRDREQREVERLERDRREREMRAADLANTLRYVDGLWVPTVSLPPEALGHFKRRGISLDDVPDQGGLRFHPRCPFDGRVLPCIVGRFTDAVTNAPGGLWRRPINGEKPKSIGPMKGHVIRLWPDDWVEQGLVIGEGVETVLAGATRVVHRATLLRPAWACGGDYNLRNFPVLPGIECLTILADNDRNGAGQSAARDCAERWAAAGREVEVLTPNAIGADFNDIVKDLP
jgi:hypothetical protein